MRKIQSKARTVQAMVRTRADLRGYQNRSIRFLHKRRFGGLLIDMGLGKTIIALTAIVDLIKAGLIDSVLLVGPIRVIEGVWRQEAREWAHTRSLVFSKIHDTSAAKRIIALNKPAHIYMINPEGLKWLRLTMGRKPWPWDMLVVDESTEFAEPKTIRFKALRSGLRHFKRRYIMTGTPTPRSLLQIWSQMYIADLGASLGQQFTDYKDNHFHKSGYMGYKLEPNEGAEDIITEAVSQRVVRLDAADWLKLPKLITTPIWVELPEQARRLYNQMEEEMFLAFDGFGSGDEEAVSETAATLSNKIRQIANGAVYTSNIETGARGWRPIHDAKINALKELVQETYGDNMLVPYQFKHDAERIAAAFPRFQMFDKKKTELLLDKWNARKIEGLILHPANASYGLNMQRGGHILAWFGATFSLRHYLQMIGRLLRSGQSHAVMNYIILARDTVDEVVLEALTGHEERQNRINNAFKMYYNKRIGRSNVSEY